MTRATFFKHFELLADQPDAVAKMRGLVMQLAIRGELIRQNPTDKHAQAIFVTQPKPMAESDAPYSLPDGWIWVQLSQLANVIRGVSYQKHDSSVTPKSGCVPVLRANNIGDGLNFDVLVYVPRSNVSPEQFIQKHDVIVAMSSGSKNLVGKAAQAKEDYDGGFGAFCGLLRLKEKIHPQYFGLFLQTPFYRERIAALGQGIGINNLQKGSLENLPIPIPPLAEQRRIVAKVDELMTLCDELEQRQQARQHASGLLQQSALHHLLAAREPQTFAAAWQRVRDHFHLLHDTPDAIPQLRQAILSLAVQGRLTEQKDKDGNADDLLQMIAKHKEKLVKAKELKARQAVEPVEISPSVLPENWAWCRLAEICLNITDGFHNTPKTTASGVRYITAQHIRPNVIDFENCFFVSEADHQELVSKTKPKKGDILVVNIGAGSGTAAIIGVAFEFSFKNVAILNKHDSIDSAYLYFVMIESRAETFDELTKGGAQPFLSLGVLRNILVPLPPLAEQKRIVARVEELLRWCDTLEAQLHQTRTLGAHLLASTLHHLLAA